VRSFCLLALLFPALLFAAGHGVSTSAWQDLPVATGNGSGFTAAWVAKTESGYRLFTGRIGRDGEPLDGAGVVIGQGLPQSVAIAHSPTETLIAWTVNGTIFTELVSPSGVPLKTIPLATVNEFPRDVAVAWNGSRYFVMWSNGFHLAGAFVASDGTTTLPRPFFGSAKELFVPDIAWTGRDFLVVFGEAPNLALCSPLCGPAYPEALRVMRVSAAGDAIDSAPLVIPGTHERVHVASSGSESLLVLDSFTAVSTMIVREENGTLSLDSELALFQWFSPVSSGVVWDGAAYTVGWRYSTTSEGPSWLGTTRVARSGLPSGASSFTVTGLPQMNDEQSWARPPSIAVNDLGEIAFVASELASSNSAPRVRLYLGAELAPMPASPPAPRNAVSYFGGRTARIDWQSDEATGFVILWSFDFGTTWSWYVTLPGNVRSVTAGASVGNLFSVSAVGPGGVSAASITSIGSMQRRRAATP